VIAAQLIAGAKLLSGLLPIPFQTTLIVVATVFTLYTFWGGQLSVIRTDLWQFLLFMGGLAVSLCFLLSSGGSVTQFQVNVPTGHLNFPVSYHFGWYQVLLFYPLIVGLPYLVGPDIYSRILCARNDKVAKRSALFAAMIVIPISFLLAFFGILARGQFPSIPPEMALPHTLNELIPIGLKGFIVAGFLGAIMSSADTCLISASTILTINVLRPLFGLEPQRELSITRATVVLLGAATWLIASRQQGIIQSLLLGYSVFVGGVVFPTLGTFLRPWVRITSRGALWAIVVGGGSAILGKIAGGALMKTILTPYGNTCLEALLGPQYLSILPVFLSIGVMLGVSRISRR
jgi:SSS family solute:Na+ symporter